MSRGRGRVVALLGRPTARRLVTPHERGQAEVTHHDPPVTGNEDVLRLEVAVHDAGAMGGIETATSGQEDLPRFETSAEQGARGGAPGPCRPRTPWRHRRRSRSAQHRRPRRCSGGRRRAMVAGFVLQVGNRRLGVSTEHLAAKDLQRDVSFEPGVVRLVDQAGKRRCHTRRGQCSGRARSQGGVAPAGHVRQERAWTRRRARGRQTWWPRRKRPGGTPCNRRGAR